MPFDFDAGAFLNTFLGLQQRQEENTQRQQALDREERQQNFMLKFRQQELDQAANRDKNELAWRTFQAKNEMATQNRETAYETAQIRMREQGLDLERQRMSALADSRSASLDEKTDYGHAKLLMNPTINKLTNTIQEKRAAGLDTSDEEGELGRINDVIDRLGQRQQMGQGFVGPMQSEAQPTPQPGAPPSQAPRQPPQGQPPQPGQTPGVSYTRVDTPEEATRLNNAYRKWAPNRVAVVGSEMDKRQMEAHETEQKMRLQEAGDAAKSAVGLNQELTQAEIPLQLQGNGTEKILVGDKAHEVPKLDFTPTTGPNWFQRHLQGKTVFDTNPNVADDLARVLIRKEVSAGSPITDRQGRVIGNRPANMVDQPTINAARRLVQQGADQVGVLTDHSKTVEVGPFDAVLNPKAHQAGMIADSLNSANDKLTALEKFHGKGSEPVSVPEVNRYQVSPTETFNRFGEVLPKMPLGVFSDKAIGGKEPLEDHLLAELKTQLDAMQPDGMGAAKGQYSDNAKQAARDLLSRLSTASQSNASFAGQAAAMVATKMRDMQSTAPQPTGMTTPKQGGLMSAEPGVNLAIQAAGVGAMGAAADVTAANKAWGTIGPNTKDKPTVAKSAVSDVSGAYGRMTDAEKKQAQNTWIAKRTIWKDQYKIPLATLKDMNEAVGLDRDDGF